MISYFPTSAIIENVAALLNQANKVVVVDNGSDKETKILLERLKSYPKVNIIYNQENLGIAAALNIGVRYARGAGYSWVVTFDQDSKVTPGMINKMLLSYEAYPEKEKVWGLSPRYQNQSTGQIATSRSKNSHADKLPYAEVLVVMTSGNLIKTSVFDVVGYFNESLFIDHVDSEFCLRCSNLGYKILEVNDAILLHCIGFPVQHRILWKIKTTSNHSSLRRYYIARNGVYIYKKFALSYPAWVAHDAFKFLKLMIMLTLFETDKKQKLAAIFKGILHGLAGKMGKLNGSN